MKSVLLFGAALGVVASATSASAQTARDEDREPAGEIIVSGQRQAYVGDLPVQDIPQNVQTVNAAVLEDLGITRVQDALDLVSGVSHMNNFGGLWDAYSVRGFSGDSNNVPTGFLVNGFNARGFAGQRDTSAIERIDVLKGPTSALFGRGEPGGTVNIVTKKPNFKTGGYIQVQAGSWNSYRADVDFNAALSDTFAARINAAYEDADSFRDTVHTRKIFVTPSILWKPTDSTSVSYELEFSSLRIPFDRGIPIYNNDFKRLPPSRYLGEPGDGPIKVETLGHQLQLQHDFSDNWSLLAGAAYRESDFKGIGEYPELVRSRQPFLQTGSTAGVLLSRQRRYADYNSKNFIGRAELTGHFEVAGMANTLVAGFDYDYFKLDQYQTRFRPAAYTGQSAAAVNAINVLNPVYGAYPLPNARATLVYDRLETDNAWGGYFYDQIELTPWLQVRAGGRYDNFHQDFLTRNTGALVTQKVTKFSPQGGVVVQPTETLSFYGSFGRGFRPNNGADVRGNTFTPETSESYEVGAKYLSPGKRISASVALFTMKKNNILAADPANSGFVIPVGAARSKGVEVDLNAKLPADFNVIVSYAYTDAHWTTEFRDPDFALPILPGDPLINVAKHSGNALVTKDFTIGSHDAMIGAGVQYIGKRLGETATTFFLPDATLVRVIASFDATDHLRVSGNVDNVFDVRWFANSGYALWTYPGTPRSFSVRAQYKF